MAVSDEVSKSWDHLETFKGECHECRLERMDTRSSKRICCICCSKAPPLSRFGGSHPGLHGMILPHVESEKCKVNPTPPHDLEHQTTRSFCAVLLNGKNGVGSQSKCWLSSAFRKGIRLGFQRSAQWCIPPY